MAIKYYTQSETRARETQHQTRKTLYKTDTYPIKKKKHEFKQGH